MLEKLPYRVAHLSGKDEKLSGNELESQTPTSKGWQSSRFCMYPQELVLGFSTLSRIRMIQLLSHEYLIASKVEVFVGSCPPDEHGSLAKSTFKRLGYFCLQKNDGTNYDSRELKSVHIDAEGNFVKLLVHKNHVNSKNFYNQVCIIAVSILGRPVIDQKEKETTEIDAECVINEYLDAGDDLKKDAIVHGHINRPDYISPLHDLAFDICQDPETAQLIRKLDSKKVQAVSEERYDYAKKLKCAITDLKVVGEKLGRLEVEKRKAVEREDYDQAKLKKLQSDEYRLCVYKQLNLFDLLEIGKNNPEKQTTMKAKDAIHVEPLKSQTHHKGYRKQLFPIVASQPERKPNHPEESTLPLESPIPEQLGKNTDDDEDVATVATKVIHSNILLPSPSEVSTAKPQEASNLTEREEDEAQPIIEAFGEDVARHLYSKFWQHRVSAADTVIGQLTSSKEGEGSLANANKTSVVNGAVAVVVKLFKDQVFAVFSQSLNLATILIADYLPKIRVSKSNFNNVLETIVPMFIHRLGDSSARIRGALVSILCEWASLPDVKASGLLPRFLTASFQVKGQIPWRPFQSRLIVIHQLLESLKIDTPEGFDLKELTKFLCRGLEHSSKGVRDSAVECILIAYAQRGKQIRRLLPQDTATTRRNPLYSKLFDSFDRTDGLPTQAERKAMDRLMNVDPEILKQKEVASLQNQLKELRSINAKYAAGKSTKSTQSTKQQKQLPHTTDPPPTSQPEVIEKMCMFCGDQNDEYHIESVLDAHYWRTCPMLQRCSHCGQVIEVSNFNDHLLRECESHGLFVKCEHCKQAVESVAHENHFKSSTCQAAARVQPNCCPLCQGEVPDDEVAWKAHLIGQCKGNAKRLQLQQLRVKGDIQAGSSAGNLPT